MPVLDLNGGSGGKGVVYDDRTWSVAGAVTVGKVPGPFLRVGTGEVPTLKEIECQLAKGSAKFKLLLNGTALKFAGGSTETPATTAAASKALETPVVLKAKDRLILECVSIATTPEGLDFTVFIEKVVTVT